MKKNYPKWRKLVWRFFRVFLVTAFALTAVYLDRADFASLDWNSFRQMVLVPTGAAVLAVTGKGLREYLGKEYPKLYKLFF